MQVYSYISSTGLFRGRCVGYIPKPVVDQEAKPHLMLPTPVTTTGRMAWRENRELPQSNHILFL